MPDTQVAQDWRKVQLEVSEQLKTLAAQEQDLQQQYDQQRSTGRVNLGLVQQLYAVRKQVAEANVALENASVQAEMAEDSPRGTIANPETAANTSPANPGPGNNTDYPPYDEFAGLDQAIQQQQNIAINTAGQAVIADDGSVIDGLAVNPETGELYTPVNLNEDPNQSTAETNRLAGAVALAQSSGNVQRYDPLPDVDDYRVRISLAPGADYLYMDAKQGDLLYPLFATKGVVYPYTPSISVAYSANYSPTDLTHTNFKMYNYTGSGIDSISITGTFTAQDVNEANYVLAVIHFFRSVTKMFYGQDQNAGVPPPLVYLYGHGEYAFNQHAMVITNFQLNYPTDCDYINAGPTYNVQAELNQYAPPKFNSDPSKIRLLTSRLQPGGIQPPPTFSVESNSKSNITRVPTKLEISISALPIVTRYNISNTFSLKKYATGELLKGRTNPAGGGIW